MSSGVDDVIFGNVDRSGENIGRHIGYKRYIYVWVKSHFCSVYRVVGGKVEIINIIGDSISFGDIREVGFFRRSDDIYFSEQFSFFDCIYSPCSGFEVSSFTVQQIIWNHTELHAGPST